MHRSHYPSAQNHTKAYAHPCYSRGSKLVFFYTLQIQTKGKENYMYPLHIHLHAMGGCIASWQCVCSNSVAIILLYTDSIAKFKFAFLIDCCAAVRLNTIALSVCLTGQSPIHTGGGGACVLWNSSCGLELCQN